MASTPSTMLALNTPAPNFSLADATTGQQISPIDYQGMPILIVFSCNHCPYVLHILDSFTEFADSLRQSAIQIVMINANDVVGYPEDSPEKMAALAESYHFSFPYLFDYSQQVAAAYRAACTPDFFLFDRQHRLAYRGQYDGARPGNRTEVNGEDLKAATAAVLDRNEVNPTQVPSMGCNIKWKVGNEPDYF